MGMDEYEGVWMYRAHVDVYESICWYMNVNDSKGMYMKMYEAI